MSSRRSHTHGRGLGAILAAFTFGAYLVLLAVPAAQAAADCTYDAVTREVTFVLQVGDGSIGIGAGGAIVAADVQDFDAPGFGAQCGVATVNNTDGIAIDAAASPAVLVVDLRGGPFAPGESPENTGTAEIEIDITDDGGLLELEIHGSDGDDTMVVGDNGTGDGGASGDGAINWNGDGDADVTFANTGSGNSSFAIFGEGGSDTISLNGGSNTGGPVEFENDLIFGGSDEDSGGSADDGNDTLTGSSFDGNVGDHIEGDEGQRHPERARGQRRAGRRR